MTGPVVIAHRGGAGEAPENTIEAFERAIRLGYPGVECDVRISKDGVPIVVHDRVVRPAPNRPFRPIRDALASELESLPTLEAFLSLPWGGMTLMVEVKPTDRDRELGALVARALVAHGLESQALIASFSEEVLRAARKAVPTLRLMGLDDDETHYTSGDRFEGLPLFGWGADYWFVDVDPDLVAAARARGRQVWIWTIKTLGQMKKALAAGVDGLITDIPGKVLKELSGPA